MGCNPNPTRTSNVEVEGEEGRSPVPFLRSVVRGRFGGEVVEKRRRPIGEFHQVEAPFDVGKDLVDDGRLGDEAHDAHSLASRAQQRVDLVDTPDEAVPRFPAGCKPGTVGARRIGRLVLGRHREDDFAPARDSAVSVRVGAVVMDEMRSPVGDVGSEACDPLQVVVVPVAGGHPLFSAIVDGSLGKVPHFRFLGRIDTEATGCGGPPDHVEPHAQRILDEIERTFEEKLDLYPHEESRAGSAGEVEVVFIVYSGDRPVSRAMYISGIHPKLGEGIPNQVAINDDGTHGDQRTGDQEWSYAAIFSPRDEAFLCVYEQRRQRPTDGTPKRQGMSSFPGR